MKPNPHSVLILGAGRSGTSLVAGTLAEAGYFMGRQLVPPREANPKGFFEDPAINALNDELLAPLIPRRTSPHDIHVPTKKHAWLARLDAQTDVRPRADLAEGMRAYTARRPYCLKDPRFCYTLPAWRPHLASGTRFVCVFRHPAATAQSVLDDLPREPDYYGDLELSHADAVGTWTAMYARVLERHRHRGEWLFLHFEQALGEAGLRALAAFTGAEVDAAFADGRLRRSRPTGTVPPEAERLYGQLCDLANYAD